MNNSAALPTKIMGSLTLMPKTREVRYRLSKSSDQTDADADHREAHSMAHDEFHNVEGLSTKRHAQAQLMSALRHGV